MPKRCRLLFVDAPLSAVASSPVGRKNQKLASLQRSSEPVAQNKALPPERIVTPVSGTTDVQDVTDAVDFSEYFLNLEPQRTDLGTSDDAKTNCESVEAQNDCSVRSVSSAKPPSSSADVLPSDGIATLEATSVDKIEQLRHLIDRAAGQLYTIAEVYLMMMKPSCVPLEYDWVNVSANYDTKDDVSNRLQKLVSIAKAAFTVCTFKPAVSSTTGNIRL